ncbi:MAG TPA: Lar family restriction alleviation protein [Sphingopyxis sp.]|nr:Lar family restriction alleviation protein [Sphingopyxis sp.]
MSGDLKPCPFCGGEAVACFNKHFGAKQEMHWVLCRNCHASPGDRGSESLAITAWNTRAELASLRSTEGRSGGAGSVIADMREVRDGCLSEGTGHVDIVRYIEEWVSRLAAQPTPDDDVIGRLVEALANAQYALEYWDRESGVWLRSRVEGARPGWMTGTRRRGKDEIARARRALADARKENDRGR